MTFPFVSLKCGRGRNWEVVSVSPVRHWSSGGRQSHKYSCVINACGAHAAVRHCQTAVARAGGICFKKRNSFTGSLLELILLHFLLVKPFGPGRKALYPSGEGLRPCDPDVAHEQEA